MKRSSKTFYLKESESFKNNLLFWAQQYQEIFWFESNSEIQGNKDGYTAFDGILAVGAQEAISCDSKQAFDTLKTFLSEQNDFAFGCFSYDLKNDIEALTSENPDHIKWEDLYFIQPKKIFFLKGNRVDLLYLNLYSDEMEEDFRAIEKFDPKITLKQEGIRIKKRITKPNYFSKIDRILYHIHRGDIYEMNFCMEFYAENILIEPLAVYQKLNRITGSPFATFLKVQDKYLLSGSPERFVKKMGNKVISQPIKGTARRSENTGEDELIKNKLASDPKERSENIMIVDLVRNDLSKTAVKGSVKVEELCGAYTFKQVHQLISTVVSEVAPDTNAVDIIKSLFPMGSMTGAPKISAMEIIEELEETKRGLYSGAVGYFTPEGDFDFNVVIRSILYNESNRYVSFSVGGAITALSTAENEYRECLLKAGAMKMALQNKLADKF